MIVDENIHNFWSTKYGELNELKRFGIEDEDGEHVVEVFLKRFNIYPIQNNTLFKFEID